MRESSLEAHEIIKPHKDVHYALIKKAMELMNNPATSKEIAFYCTSLTYHEVARRLSEMERNETVRVCGRKWDQKARPMLWELVKK